jgi:pimeloyl-ACP methyl ester carboxylesterase
MAEQTRELARTKLPVPMLGWAGQAPFGSDCFDCAKAIAASAKGGVVEQCGHWVFEEKTDFIVQELRGFWDDMQRTQVEDKPVLA